MTDSVRRTGRVGSSQDGVRQRPFLIPPNSPLTLDLLLRVEEVEEEVVKLEEKYK